MFEVIVISGFGPRFGWWYFVCYGPSGVIQEDRRIKSNSLGRETESSMRMTTPPMIRDDDAAARPGCKLAHCLSRFFRRGPSQFAQIRGRRLPPGLRPGPGLANGIQHDHGDLALGV